MTGVDYAGVDRNMVDPSHASISFAIARAAYVYKGVCCADPCVDDRSRWTAVGVPFGAYVIVSYDPKGPSPEDQARCFVRAYGARRDGELPPWIDAETNSIDSSKTTDAQRLDYVQRVYMILQRYYGVIGTYTSENQWSTNFGDVDSMLGDGPLWLKVPYPYRANNPPHPEAVPALGTLPVPWRKASSPGAWIEQYQGDAKGVAGFSSTVDCNVWLPQLHAPVASGGLLSPWERTMLARMNCTTVQDFQRARGLVPDGIIGPKTFAALAR